MKTKYSIIQDNKSQYALEKILLGSVFLQGEEGGSNTWEVKRCAAIRAKRETQYKMGNFYLIQKKIPIHDLKNARFVGQN